MELMLHPTSRQRLDLFSRDMPQSLLINGERGVGLETIAKVIGGKNIAAILRPQNAKEERDDERGTIGVAMIRQMYGQTRAKHMTKQVIIIDNADRMSSGAQAAFLKLLEEPNEHIYFILTSHASQKLLPTIRSRVQELAIHEITGQQTKNYIDTLQVTNATKQAQLMFIAAGLPAELARLVNDEDYFNSRAKIVGDARTFLQADAYQKMLVIQKYYSDREAALQLIDSALQILRRTMSAKPQDELVKQLAGLLEVHNNIAAQYNIRLQLTRFVI